MNKIIKEPLVHFFLLGALLYLASMIVGDSDIQTQGIIVSEGKIKHLETLYQKTWQRNPTKAELENLVQEYVLEQAAYYEGINLGLDKNDIVIVRRVRQKLDFIAEESSSRPEATDELLSVYLQDNMDKFRLDSTFTLRQVYFDPKKNINTLKPKVKRILAELSVQPDQDISKLGDRYLFKPYYQKQQLTEIERLWGQRFALATKEITVGSWHGPIRSSYGVHLVYIEKKQDGVLPPLSQIRSSVLREWENSLRKQSTKKYYDDLLQRYPAIIHWPSENKI